MNFQCHCSNKRRHCSDCGHLMNHARAFNNAKCLSRDYHHGKQYKTGQLQRFIPFLCHSHLILANECVFFFHNLILLCLKLESSSPHISARRIHIIRLIPRAGQVRCISGIAMPNEPLGRENSLPGGIESQETEGGKNS